MTTEKQSHSRNCQNKLKPRKVGRHEYLTDRDSQILKYLWRWKVASTASVHEAINKIASQYSTYKILDKLESKYVMVILLLYN